MSRKTQILDMVGDNAILVKMVDEMMYLEGELDELRELPKIKVDGEDKRRQKLTPAAKLYKDYLQQYVNVVKALIRATGSEGASDDSPLREWLKKNGMEC